MMRPWRQLHEQKEFQKKVRGKILKSFVIMKIDEKSENKIDIRRQHEIQ